MRSSPDGRFIANSIPRIERTDLPLGNYGYILDLKLKNQFGEPRTVAVNGLYDPGFFPDNRSFTWHTGRGASICQQSILSENVFVNSIQTFDLFNHSQCTYFNGMDTYQYPSASLDQNFGSTEYWAITSTFAGDDAGYSWDPNSDEISDPDPKIFAKEQSKVKNI